MADWMFDEDITRTTVELFNKAGITGKHVEYDLHKGGLEDEPVLELAKKQKSTLITANVGDFKKLPNVGYNNSYGVFMLNTDDPEEQVRLLRKALNATGLNTLNKRKEKKVNVRTDGADVLDTRTNETTTVAYHKKRNKKK